MKTRALIVVALLASLFAAVPAAPAGANPDPIRYLALGDSAAAGEGLGPFVDAACARSVRAHPYLIPNTTLQHLACTGATSADAIDQLAAADPADLITVSAGANDIEFADLLEGCIMGSCAEGIEQVDFLVDELTLRYTKLRQTGATVLATGYPQLFESPNPCVAVLGFSLNAGEWVNGRLLTDRLNLAIETAAARAGVHYVDISEWFQGHGLCTADPWVNNLIVEFVFIFPTVLPASFHPTLRGQQEYAAAISDHLATHGSGGALPANPAPVSAPYPAPVFTSPNLTVTPSCGTSDLTSPGAVLTISGSGFNPSSAVNVTLTTPGATTTPVRATPGAGGAFSTTMTVPTSTTLTSANVRIEGINAAGFTHQASHTMGLDWFTPACDTTAPTISVSRPTVQQTFTVGQVVTPLFSCSDDRAVASCTADKSVLPTTPGSHTVNFKAIDLAGHVTNSFVVYRARYVASFPGFSLGTTTLPAGTTSLNLPIELRNASGTVLTNTSAVRPTITYGSCTAPNTPSTRPFKLVGPTRINLLWSMAEVGVGQCARIRLAIHDGAVYTLTVRKG